MLQCNEPFFTRLNQTLHKMASNVFETAKSADWHIKALFTVVILLVSLLANEWINKLWLSWRLRKYPIANHGKPQEEFMRGAASVMRKGLDTVSDHDQQHFYRVNDALKVAANHKLLLIVQGPTFPR